jgi:hypothetical protein
LHGPRPLAKGGGCPGGGARAEKLLDWMLKVQAACLPAFA